MTQPRRALVFAAGLAVAVPDIASAQRRGADERLHDVSVDVGGVALRRWDESWRPAVSVFPHWRTTTRDGAFYLGGAVSGTQEGYESAFGTLGLELAPRSATREWDLAGTATVLGARSTDAIGVATLRGRKHWISESQGAWVGITVGGRAQDEARFGSLVAEASVWRSVTRATTLLLSASATQAGDFLDYRYSDAPETAFRVPHAARFGELTAAMRHIGSRVELALDGRYRMGAPEVLGGSAAVSGDVAVWVTPNYAIVGVVGRHLADPALGTATTTFASFGLRIAARSIGARHASASSAREPLPVRRPALLHPGELEGAIPFLGGAEVELSATHEGTRLVLFVAADTVEIAGDFSDWQPVGLVRQGRAWQLPGSLAPGVYRLIMRVNGGEWRVPNGLPRLRDDFGGEVGVVTIR